MQANVTTPVDHAAPKPKRGTINAQPLHAAQIADALLTIRTASAISGLSSATLYRKAASDPSFPKLVRLGNRCTRIRAGDLTDWLAAQSNRLVTAPTQGSALAKVAGQRAPRREWHGRLTPRFPQGSPQPTGGK